MLARSFEMKLLCNSQVSQLGADSKCKIPRSCAQVLILAGRTRQYKLLRDIVNYKEGECTSAEGGLGT